MMATLSTEDIEHVRATLSGLSDDIQSHRVCNSASQDLISQSSATISKLIAVINDPLFTAIVDVHCYYSDLLGNDKTEDTFTMSEHPSEMPKYQSNEQYETPVHETYKAPNELYSSDMFIDLEWMNALNNKLDNHYGNLPSLISEQTIHNHRASENDSFYKKLKNSLCLSPEMILNNPEFDIKCNSLLQQDIKDGSNGKNDIKLKNEDICSNFHILNKDATQSKTNAHITLSHTNKQCSLSPSTRYRKRTSFLLETAISNPLEWDDTIEALRLHGCSVNSIDSVTKGTDCGADVGASTFSNEIPAILHTSFIGDTHLTQETKGLNRRYRKAERLKREIQAQIENGSSFFRTECSISEPLRIVELVKRPTELGINLVGSEEHGLFIADVVSHEDDVLHRGDQMLVLNEQRLDGSSQDDVMQILKDVHIGDVVIIVTRFNLSGLKEIELTLEQTRSGSTNELGAIQGIHNKTP